MSFIKKIIVFIVIALTIGFIVTKFTLQKDWSYAFVPVHSTKITPNSFVDANWETPLNTNKMVLYEHKENLTLILTKNFNVKDLLAVKAILVAYHYRFSVEIYINNKKCLSINKNLITPENPFNNTLKTGIDVFGYGVKRVFILKESLDGFIHKGKNTVHIVVTNTEKIKSFRINKISLSVVDKEAPKSATVFKSSTLPIFTINTNYLTIPDEPKIKASLNVIEGKGINSLTDSSMFFPIKIEVRGTTSQSFAKPSYSFNVYDKNGAKKSVGLLGLPASKEWVLQGPYADKSLIRNALTYALYRQMGNYAPKTEFVELIINNNYRGIYVLTEKIQIGKEHLNIKKLKQDKIDYAKQTGGYLLEIDRAKWRGIYPPKGSSTTRPVAYEVFSPKKEKINPFLEQKIKTQFNDFEQHLYEDDNIFNYLDVNSFVDYFIITEFTKNTDGYCLSTFLYNKDINNTMPKFYIGPIWDYNLTFGLANYRESFSSEGFIYTSTKYIPFWWKKLLANDEFVRVLKDRYSTLRLTTLSDNNINSTIDALAQACAKSTELNFKKWTILGGSAPWPNYYTGQTYKDEIDYIKNWTANRLLFLDTHFLH